MGIQASSVKAANLVAVSPNGTEVAITSVTFNPANGQAVYNLTKTWTHLDTGRWTIKTTAEGVLDTDGNKVAAGTSIGNFQVTIAQPVNANPPTISLVSIEPGTITAAGSSTVVITVNYTDPA